MSEFIVIGIGILTGVNWLYSRYCEGHSSRQGMGSGAKSRRLKPA